MDGQLSLFKTGDLRGLMDNPYCPTCGIALNDYVDQCDECGQLISWERWKSYLQKEGLWERE